MDLNFSIPQKKSEIVKVFQHYLKFWEHSSLFTTMQILLNLYRCFCNWKPYFKVFYSKHRTENISSLVSNESVDVIILNLVLDIIVLDSQLTFKKIVFKKRRNTVWNKLSWKFIVNFDILKDTEQIWKSRQETLKGENRERDRNANCKKVDFKTHICKRKNLSMSWWKRHRFI